MSDRTTGQTVIEIFNNWFLNEHGMLPEQAIDRIHDLEAQRARVRELPGKWRKWKYGGKNTCADELEAALAESGEGK